MFDITEDRITGVIDANSIQAPFPLWLVHPEKKRDGFLTHAVTHLPVSIEEANGVVGHIRGTSQLASIIYDNRGSFHPYAEPYIAYLIEFPTKICIFLGEALIVMNHKGEICDVLKVLYFDEED